MNAALALVLLVAVAFMAGLVIPVAVWPWVVVAGLAVFVTGALFVPRRR